MGSWLGNGSKIEIYIETTNPSHTAGENVEGFIYINAKRNENYGNLAL